MSEESSSEESVESISPFSNGFCPNFFRVPVLYPTNFQSYGISQTPFNYTPWSYCDSVCSQLKRCSAVDTSFPDYCQHQGIGDQQTRFTGNSFCKSNICSSSVPVHCLHKGICNQQTRSIENSSCNSANCSSGVPRHCLHQGIGSQQNISTGNSSCKSASCSSELKLQGPHVNVKIEPTSQHTQITSSSQFKSQCTQVNSCDLQIVEENRCKCTCLNCLPYRPKEGFPDSSLTRFCGKKDYFSDCTEVDNSSLQMCLCKISSPLKDSSGKCFPLYKCPCYIFSSFINNCRPNYTFTKNCSCVMPQILKTENVQQSLISPCLDCGKGRLQPSDVYFPNVRSVLSRLNERRFKPCFASSQKYISDCRSDYIENFARSYEKSCSCDEAIENILRIRNDIYSTLTDLVESLKSDSGSTRATSHMRDLLSKRKSSQNGESENLINKGRNIKSTDDTSSFPSVRENTNWLITEAKSLAGKTADAVTQAYADSDQQKTDQHKEDGGLSTSFSKLFTPNSYSLMEKATDAILQASTPLTNLTSAAAGLSSTAANVTSAAATTAGSLLTKALLQESNEKDDSTVNSSGNYVQMSFPSTAFTSIKFDRGTGSSTTKMRHIDLKKASDDSSSASETSALKPGNQHSYPVVSDKKHIIGKEQASEQSVGSTSSGKERKTFCCIKRTESKSKK